ncbi:ABC transporter ATP-binding protein/permease [Patescibacteria group bacterium]|nr:ABC transporter ATP-binding protein/permease [Patescibacteria group bacterium]
MQIKKDIKILWKYLQKYKKKVYFIASISIVSAIISASIPYIYGRLVDEAIKESTKIELIFGILGLWLLLVLIINWLDRFVTKKGVDVGARASNDFTVDACDHVLHLSVVFHKDKKMGEVLNRIGRASGYFESIIHETVFSLAPSLLTMFVGLGILAYVEWRLALATLAMVLFYILVTVIKTKPIMKTQKVLNKSYEKTFGDIYGTFANIQVVKSSIAESLEKSKNIFNFNNVAKKLRTSLKAWTSMGAWQQFVSGLGFVVVFGMGVFMLRAKTVSPGEFIMFIGYLNLVRQPVAYLAYNYRMLKKGMTAIDRVVVLFKIKPEKYEKGIILKEIKGNVVFKNVGFSYKKGKQVLKNINFNVSPGENIALVGESGVGKTTLVDLISRYYSTKKGKVFIDGKNIERINLHSLRKHIAIVPQEISLFNDTIKNNIAYGNLRASGKEIIKVAKAANAHEFIDKFPKKYKQIVGERGIKLSTGQKQRIAIARALLRDPKILILDEATSSLDSVSEKLVQDALEKLIKGRTTFIIAHRLSTISHADKILVLEKGKIVESGNHKDLMNKKDGIYRKFYMMQSASHKDTFKDETVTN